VSAQGVTFPAKFMSKIEIFALYFAGGMKEKKRAGCALFVEDHWWAVHGSNM
jgi:hypothetical protein